VKHALAFVGCVVLVGCAPALIPSQAASPSLLATVSFTTAPQEPERLVAPEVLLRSYLRLFGAATPLDAEKLARGNDGRKLFDNWTDYLSALGLPDYRNDLPRALETNALMVSTFERIAEALCDRAIERDLHAKLAIGARSIYAFDLPLAPLDRAAFAPRFDVLHRTFLAYPVALAPPNREADFFALYQKVVARHATQPGKPNAKHERFTPSEAGLAAVCVALARHPELHFY
jgi:hypothetical protein